MQLLRKTQSQSTRLDQQQIFSDKFLILKFLFDELEQFYSSSSSSSEKLFFRVQVRVRQNNRVFRVRVQVQVRVRSSVLCVKTGEVEVN